MLFQSPYSLSSSPYVSQYPYSHGGFAPTMNVARYGYDPSDYYQHQHPHHHHHHLRYFPSYQPAPVSHPHLVLRAVPAYESARAAHSARLIDDLEDLIRLGVLAQAEAQQHQQLLNETQSKQQVEPESVSKPEAKPEVAASKPEAESHRVPIPIHRPGKAPSAQAPAAAKEPSRQVSQPRRGRGLFDVFSDLFGLAQMEPQDTFNTKMKEEDKQYVIEAQLPPGVTKDEVELNVENHLLTLTATVKAKPKTQQTDTKEPQQQPQEGQPQSESHERKKSVVVEDENESENESVQATEATQPKPKPKTESESAVQPSETKSESESSDEPKLVERSYTRIIQLPENASEDGIEAKFQDQILRICVPKIQPKKTHKITIQ